MGLTGTPNSQRPHIVFFGSCNVGKSSLINAITGQEIALVSESAGTTTDPVRKAMELIPAGPVLLIDTPGLDDESELGKKRVLLAKKEIKSANIAIIVSDATQGMSPFDEQIISIIKEKKIPFIHVYNKADLTDKSDFPYVSAKNNIGIEKLKEELIKVLKDNTKSVPIVSDILKPNDKVILVVPLDLEAPKGRLILPQQLVIRDLLDAGIIPVLSGENNLTETIDSLKEAPSLIITDSQIFKSVKQKSGSLPLTSFSILMARHKGNLDLSVQGAFGLDDLRDGDRILIAEGCTHHTTCEDIGTIKLPKWIREYTKADIKIDFTTGVDFPEELSSYKLIIHCGGCMLPEKAVFNRYIEAKRSGVLITNYGTAIAHINGILKDSISMFKKDFA